MRNKRVQNEHSSCLNAEQYRAAWQQSEHTGTQPTFARNNSRNLSCISYLLNFWNLFSLYHRHHLDSDQFIAATPCRTIILTLCFSCCYVPRVLSHWLPCFYPWNGITNCIKSSGTYFKNSCYACFIFCKYNFKCKSHITSAGLKGQRNTIS